MKVMMPWRVRSAVLERVALVRSSAAAGSDTNQEPIGSTCFYKVLFLLNVYQKSFVVGQIVVEPLAVR